MSVFDDFQYKDLEKFVNKGIDAYVDIEQAKHTTFAQPLQVTSNEGSAYVSGSSGSKNVAANTDIPWVLIGVLGVGVVAFMFMRK